MRDKKSSEETLENKYLKILSQAPYVLRRRDSLKMEVAELQHKMIAVGSPKPSEGGGGGSTTQRDQRMISLIMKKDIIQTNLDIRQQELDWMISSVNKVCDPCARGTVIKKYMLHEDPFNANIEHNVKRFLSVSAELLDEWEQLQHEET